MTGVQTCALPISAATERNRELQRELDSVNAGFEEFVSMAAHNVREPLREITAYSQLLAESAKGDGEATGAEFLAHIQAGAARIESLTTAIVDYWCASAGRDACRTEMEAVLAHALLVKGKKLLERNATVTHGPLPAVLGDFDLLAKVLRHLIRNAVEYSEAAIPTIHISSRRLEEEWVVSVTDNGPGIDAVFHERVFGTFRRLHGKEHPGNGLGLSFCRKAIAWHGGRIWVDSAAGSGATFHFTVPAAD